MNSGDLFQEKLQQHNNKFEDCFKEESREVFGVAENEKNISYTKDYNLDDELGLKLINPGQQLGFLALDNCYFKNLKDFTGERCDCLLFTNKEFLFVELKLDITSKRRTTENLKEGRKQLSNTIAYFHNHFINEFLLFNRNAIAVIPKQYYPRNSARLAKIKKEFLLKNFGVEYFENSEYTFNNKK